MKQAHRQSEFLDTEHLQGDLKRRSVRGAVFMASGGSLELFIKLISIPILARLLSPEDFGLVAMVTAFTAIVDAVQDAGLGTATVQRRGLTVSQVSNLFWLNTAIGTFFAVAVWASSSAIAGFYKEPRLIGITVGISICFLITGVSVQHEAVMNRQMRQGELAFIRLLGSVSSIALAIALALKGWEYWALVWREVSRSAFVAAGVWVRCRWLPGLPSRGQGTRSLLRFGGELTATNLLTALIANVDRLLIGRFFGPVPVGLYRQAQLLLTVPIDQLNGPIMGVAQPALSALQSDPDRYRRYYEKIVLLVSLATIPLGLFVAVYAEEITLLILGPTWIEASSFVTIFGVAAAMRPAIATSATVMITCGKTRRFLAVAIGHSLALTAFMLLGVRWGAEGVALAHVATTLVVMVPKLYYSFIGSPVKLRGFLGAALTPLVAGSVMVVALVALKRFVPLPGAVVSLGFGAIAGALVYAMVSMLQRRSRHQLITTANDFVSSFRRRPGGGPPVSG